MDFFSKLIYTSTSPFWGTLFERREVNYCERIRHNLFLNCFAFWQRLGERWQQEEVAIPRAVWSTALFLHKKRDMWSTYLVRTTVLHSTYNFASWCYYNTLFIICQTKLFYSHVIFFQGRISFASATFLKSTLANILAIFFSILTHPSNFCQIRF